MSIKQMTLVWERVLTHPQQAIMLALADHANEDGAHVFPSLGLVAWKTGYSLRHVKRTMESLRRMGALVVVAQARRGRPIEYRIRIKAAPEKPSFSKAKGDTTTPQSHRSAVTSAPVGVTSVPSSGDTSGHIEPSLEPSGETKPSPARGIAEHDDQPAEAEGVFQKATRAGHRQKSSTPDSRHGPIRALIQQLHQQKYGIQCQWDASEATVLNRLLAANPSWSLDQIAQMVRNRFDSASISSSRPSSWLRRLDDYATGPLDRYGKTTIGRTDATSRAERDEQQTHDAIGKAGRNLVARKATGRTHGVGQGDFPKAATDRHPS
jgi:hypothetical protein